MGIDEATPEDRACKDDQSAYRLEESLQARGCSEKEGGGRE